MKFYEIFLSLASHGREIGRTCIQLQERTPFLAAVAAEDAIDGRYGKEITCHTIRVEEITEDEFVYGAAIAA